jgi:hypothetical protein
MAELSIQSFDDAAAASLRRCSPLSSSAVYSSAPVPFILQHHYGRGLAIDNHKNQDMIGIPPTYVGVIVSVAGNIVISLAL